MHLPNCIWNFAGTPKVSRRILNLFNRQIAQDENSFHDMVERPQETAWQSKIWLNMATYVS